MNGTSLKPLIDGTETSADSSERTALTVVKLWGKNGLKYFSIRTKDWRFNKYGNNKEELYHNKTDPDEIINLADNKEYIFVKPQFKKQLEQSTKNAK